MGLLIRGRVVSVTPTKGGEWTRVIVAGTGRINDLVMVPADQPAPEAGKDIEAPVRAQVETTQDGRPMRSIVYWLDTPRPAAVKAAG